MITWALCFLFASGKVKGDGVDSILVFAMLIDLFCVIAISLGLSTWRNKNGK